MAAKIEKIGKITKTGEKDEALSNLYEEYAHPLAVCKPLNSIKLLLLV